jgi:hypothetical protein
MRRTAERNIKPPISVDLDLANMESGTGNSPWTAG